MSYLQKKKVKVIVQFSGGKDSQAALLWAIQQYGEVEAVFCDTGWEHQATYDHIAYVVETLGIECSFIYSKKFKGMAELARKKKRFPSQGARFCTSELKVRPFIDFVLERCFGHIIVVQGIRAQESAARAKLDVQCSFFKQYLDNQKSSLYRKREVLEWMDNYDASVVRPLLHWQGDEVIRFILGKGMRPHPFYQQGFRRVGCFPCIHCRMSEIREIVTRYPERVEEVSKLEQEVGSSFFACDKIPQHSCDWEIFDKEGNKKKTATIRAVAKYVVDKNPTDNLLGAEYFSCSSHYHGLCE